MPDLTESILPPFAKSAEPTRSELNQNGKLAVASKFGAA
jgi:hypothetical protein